MSPQADFRGAVLGSHTAKISQFPLSHPHSCLRKKAQLADRVTTDVQALSHPGAAACHSHKHALDLADEPDLSSSSWLFTPLLLLLQELSANYLPSVKANIVIAQHVLQM